MMVIALKKCIACVGSPVGISDFTFISAFYG